MADQRDASITDLLITIPDPPEPWALVVRARHEMKEWKAHISGFESRLYAGTEATAIHYRGEYYRIEEQASDGREWTYRMRVWPENDRIIQPFELSAEAFAAARLDQRAEKIEGIRNAVAPLYDFLPALLPLRFQEIVSDRLGFDPVDASKRSAIFCLLFGVFLKLPFSPSFGMGPVMNLTVSSGLMAEGLMRMMYIIAHGDGCGFIPLQIGDWAFRKIRGNQE